MIKNTRENISSQWYNLKVTAVVRESDRSVTLTLECSENNYFIFFQSGQYVNVIVEVDGKSYCRSYSISSAPYEEALRITVQKIEGGIVSNYLNGEIQEGDILTCSQPCGDFVIKSMKKKKLFIAAGSGITPIISLLKSHLYSSTEYCHLYYFSRSVEETVFRNDISSLCTLYHDRLYVSHWHSVSQGRFDFDLKKLGGMNDAILGAPDVYMCGPNEWMESFQKALTPYRFSLGKVYKEHFTAAKGLVVDETEEVNVYCVSIQIDGVVYTVDVKSSESILESLIRNDVPVVYGCELGKCGCCLAKVVSGNVDNSRINFLTQEELDDGFTLCCQARAGSDCLLYKH